MSHLTTHKYRESRYLRAYKAPVFCHLSSVNRPLHLSRILYKSTFLCKTNPILSAVGGLQMNVNSLITMNYKIFIPLAGYKNKPDSNPIQTQFPKSPNECKLICYRGLQKKR